MQYWFDTVETIPAGLGWSHFSGYHFLWLGVMVAVCAVLSVAYRRQSEAGRQKLSKAVALLILGDELFKMVMLALGRRYLVDYLPLHLCSINIFIILFHAWHPTKTVDNFLYIVCIPGALAAMLFSTWTSLPVGNFMHLHSFTVHILLIAYPVMRLAGGDLKPQIRYLPKCLCLLGAFGLVALIANLLLDTNFMFLMYAEEGNPLLLFENWFGSHLVGFPVLIGAIVAVMYTPVYLLRRLSRK